MMQFRVSQYDGHAQTGSSGSARSGRIRPPEPVEHSGTLFRGHANAVIAHADYYHSLIGGKTDLNRLALREIDGISEKIAYDTAYTTRIDSHKHFHVGHMHIQWHMFGLGDGGNRFNRLFDGLAYIGLHQIKRRIPGVETRNLQQIGEHS